MSQESMKRGGPTGGGIGPAQRTVRRLSGITSAIASLIVLFDGKWITTGALLVIAALIQPELVGASRIGRIRLARWTATVAMIPAGLVMYLFAPPEKAPAPKAPSEPSAAAYTMVAEGMIRQKLRDPDSAKFRDVRVGGSVNGKIICGYVNSRNGFGGMTGDQRFAVSGMAVLEEELAPGEMDLIWSHCPPS